jgi:serine protease
VSGGRFVGVTTEGRPVIEASSGVSVGAVRERIATAGGDTQLVDAGTRSVTDLIVSYVGAPPPLNVDGVSTVATYPPGPFMVVRSDAGFTPRQLGAIAELPGVQGVEPDYPFESFATSQAQGTIPNDPSFGRQWALARIHAPAAWSVVRRTPVVVAVIDSGTDLGHPDLRNNLWTNAQNQHGYDFVAPDHDPSDTKGHGTHAAGIIAAEADNDEGVAGVIWRGSIMSLRIYTGVRDTASASRAAMAIDFAVNNGARVLSLSWGGPNFPDALRRALDRAIARDAIIVAAAGNGGPDGVGDNNDKRPVFPASYQSRQVVAVMSVGRNDERSPFSNYGAASVQIAAPGENILSTAPLSAYAIDHGTSIAAPFVAAAAALTWGHPAYSKLKAPQIVQLLLEKARQVPALAGLSATGAVLDLAFLGSLPASPKPAEAVQILPLIR